MNEGKSIWKDEFKRQTVSLIILLLVAILAALFGRHLDRAKPNAEIANIYLSGSMPKDYPVYPSFDIRIAADNIPFDVNAKKYILKKGEWDAGYKRLKSELEALKNIPEPILNEIIKILNNRREGYPKDALRHEVLKVWDRGPGDLLFTIMKGTLYSNDYYKKLTKKHPKYKTHPPEWKNSETAFVKVTSTKAFKLSEQIIKEKDSEQERFDKNLNNIFRRLWIYLDRDILIEVLSKTIETVDECRVKTEDFLQLMKQEEETFDPNRIEVKLLLSNTGKKPFVVSGYGLLKLIVNKKIYPIEMHAYIKNSIKPSGFYYISGEKCTIATFFSKKTIKELDDEFFKNDESKGNNESTIETLYDTSLLNAEMKIADVTTDEKPTIISTTRKGIFGQEASTLYKKLFY